MQVFFKTTLGAVFSIEVNVYDTLLGMKQNIEKSLGIPASEQTLHFKGNPLLKDHLHLIQCGIVHRSLLEIFFPPLYQPNPYTGQVLHQTKQSPAPSNPIKDIIYIEDSPEKNQDSTVLERRSNDDQVLHQTEQSPVPSNSIEEYLNIQDWPVNDDQVLHQTEQSPVPSNSLEEFLNVQDSSGENNDNQLLQRESSQPSNSFGDLMYGEDLPLSTEHFTNIQSFGPGSSTQEITNIQDSAGIVKNQVLQTEKSPPVIDIPESSAKKPPQRLRVMVFPFSLESITERKFPVDVNASENVEELRKELEKIQQLNLPEEGYFFIHKQRVLDDNQSFSWNDVAHGDTIEIFPGHVTHDGPTDSRVRPFGR